MKMKLVHYQYIEKAIYARLYALCEEKSCTIADIVASYENGQFLNAEKTKDLNKRFRWDCFHGAKLSSYACDVLYDYLDDNHIDTALKRICPQSLVRKF